LLTLDDEQELPPRRARFVARSRIHTKTRSCELLNRWTAGYLSAYFAWKYFEKVDFFTMSSFGVTYIVVLFGILLTPTSKLRLRMKYKKRKGFSFISATPRDSRERLEGDELAFYKMKKLEKKKK